MNRLVELSKHDYVMLMWSVAVEQVLVVRVR